MAEGIPLFHTSQIRAAERFAISQLGHSESSLMELAGQAAFQVLQGSFPHAKKILVYCGGGNNAGDGYILARLLHEAGLHVHIHAYRPPNALPQAARDAANAALETGISYQSLEEAQDFDADLIVDALLGTGLRDEVSDAMAFAINQINALGIPVLSIDVPSGLEANTGNVMGVCVRATVCITFIAHKLGFVTLNGPDYCKEVVCDDLGLSTYFSQLTPDAKTMDLKVLARLLPKRLRNCNKKDFGHVLIIGGSYGMPGSVIMAAEAALRIGAGAVTIATRSQYAAHAIAGLPEAMIYGIEEAESLQFLLERASVCVIGPGLGEDEWAIQMFKKAIASQMPIVVDASALRILAQKPQQDDNWVLTPHPGEAAALLHTSVQGILNNRYEAVSLLQAQYGGHMVLKGVGTLVRSSEPLTYVCTRGNAGMATAGMGDVLSGVIAGLAAQGLALLDAACLGVGWHAMAADLAVEEHGERGLLASDLMPFLRYLANYAPRN